MESDSQPASCLEFVKTFVASIGNKRKQTRINVANILGGAIALITLVLPLLAIAPCSQAPS
ncbi:MAG: hypothetical protein SXA11_07885 [Cyanobacteriota bacterium]|nr:hypothetical protein [Cyanobacteriota bacterium]